MAERKIVAKRDGHILGVISLLSFPDSRVQSNITMLAKFSEETTDTLPPPLTTAGFTGGVFRWCTGGKCRYFL